MATNVQTPDVDAVRAQIRAELEPVVRAEFEEKLEIWKTSELLDLEKEQDAKIQEGLRKYVDQWRDEQKPLSREEIQQMLSQEYAEFEVKVRNRSGETLTFVICELPMGAEELFYKKFKDQLMARTSDLAALAQKTMDQGMDTKIKAFLSTFEGAFDILADAVTIVLNYDKKHDYLTRDWVKANISSSRQWAIVEAQMEVNKLRDFFSRLSRSGLKAQSLTTPPNVQTLPQLLVK